MQRRKNIHFHTDGVTDGSRVVLESVWGRPTTGGHYVIAGLPYFAREATQGDIVDVRAEGAALWYRATVTASPNSLLRAVVPKGAWIEETKEELEDIGCTVDFAPLWQVLAVGVPPEASLEEVRAFLTAEVRAERLRSYEEVLLRPR
jgi:hypothetical protein